jgi:cytochrome c553
MYVEQQLKNYRSGQRQHEIMNVVARPLSDADIADLAAWYASIAIEATAR